MALRALPAGFTEVSRGPITLIARDDVRDPLERAGALDDVAPSGLGAVESELGGGRTPIPVVRVHGIDARLVIKTLRRGGVLGSLLGRKARADRAYRELLLNASLRAAGVRTPPIVAVRLRRWIVRPIVRVETFAELVPTAVDLERFVRQPGSTATRRAVIDAAGRSLGSLHAAGVAHPDLNVRNLVVDRDRAVHVIDLGSGSSASPARVTVTFARLARSAIKRGLVPGLVGRTDCARFLRAAIGSGWRDQYRAAATALDRTLFVHRIAWRVFG